jgi:hypothetical protein
MRSLTENKYKKYWYEKITEWCPACGKETTRKHRSYTKKPKGLVERHCVREVWDGCEL